MDVRKCKSVEERQWNIEGDGGKERGGGEGETRETRVDTHTHTDENKEKVIEWQTERGGRDRQREWNRERDIKRGHKAWWEVVC